MENIMQLNILSKGIASIDTIIRHQEQHAAEEVYSPLLRILKEIDVKDAEVERLKAELQMRALDVLVESRYNMVIKAHDITSSLAKSTPRLANMLKDANPLPSEGEQRPC
jgi:hypothetical protein